MEDDDFLEVARSSPARDGLARVFRWLTLLFALGVLVWVALYALEYLPLGLMITTREP